jgi:hypothetical protein
MAVRIRWEIVRPFVLENDVVRLARISAWKLRFDLQTCFNNIFIEAEFRGNFSPGDVLNAFESIADKDKIEAIIKEWEELYPKIWCAIGFPDVTETFSEVLSQPFSAEDIVSLNTAMRKLEEMNGEFLDMAVQRAKVLIHEELAIATASSNDPPGAGKREADSAQRSARRGDSSRPAQRRYRPRSNSKLRELIAEQADR